MSTPKKTLATLDLTSDSERAVMELIQHMHGGRYPTWRMRDIRREGDVLIELAEWRRGGYVLLTWSLLEIRVKMDNQPSLAAARRAFEARRSSSAHGAETAAASEDGASAQA